MSLHVPGKKIETETEIIADHNHVMEPLQNLSDVAFGDLGYYLYARSIEDALKLQSKGPSSSSFGSVY